MSMEKKIQKRQLGVNGPLVSAIGLGTMGFGAFYGATNANVQEVLTCAADRGMTFWDCADVYGTSEDELGKWFETTGRRSEVFLATKFGAWDPEVPPPNPNSGPISKPFPVRNLSVPVEIVLESLRDFVESGQVKWIGLCECSIDTLRRAKALKGLGEKVIAVQMEYSPSELSIKENGFAEEATQLGLGIIAYSPLGRGLLSGRFRSRADFDANDLRLLLPRFSAENFSNNLELADKFKAIAAKYDGVTPSQVVLAWILAESPSFIPIPGCRSAERVEENAKSTELNLSPEDMDAIKDLVNAADVRGSRYPPSVLDSCQIDSLPLDAWSVSQSVKDVLQSLVDDGLVQADKIGSSNFFWSFPSQRGSMLQNRLNAVKDTHSDLQKQLAETKANMDKERSAREETDERAEALAELSSARAELASLEKEMSQYGSCDPVKLEAKRRAVTLGQEAAARWTDNVMLLQSYFTRQRGVDPGDVRQYLGIGEDFEDIC
ncbi:Aldo/keto reductase [Schizopora paradoxa]|uniref:Aldo/keto reductase n=1 Tax=Schizopora paradoxa TaxID=27342 RepID=A0A0H2S1X5_9AGAM|nr:Aldo/keto reductase [Schizopora paradoxa]